MHTPCCMTPVRPCRGHAAHACKKEADIRARSTRSAGSPVTASPSPRASHTLTYAVSNLSSGSRGCNRANIGNPRICRDVLPDDHRHCSAVWQRCLTLLAEPFSSGRPQHDECDKCDTDLYATHRRCKGVLRVRSLVGTIHSNRQWPARTTCRDTQSAARVPFEKTGPTRRIAGPQLDSKHVSPTRFHVEVSATVDTRHLTTSSPAMWETAFPQSPWP